MTLFDWARRRWIEISDVGGNPIPGQGFRDDYYVLPNDAHPVTVLPSKVPLLLHVVEGDEIRTHKFMVDPRKPQIWVRAAGVGENVAIEATTIPVTRP
jgi:hypothetical protein